MPKFRTFLALPAADRFATFEAMAMLALARLLVALVPLKYWRGHMGIVTGPQDLRPAPSPADIAAGRRIRKLLQRADRNLPAEFICLPTALAARWMLRRRGIASDLFIGTRKTPEGEHKFHAWLKLGDHWVTGEFKDGFYATFASKPAQGNADG